LPIAAPSRSSGRSGLRLGTRSRSAWRRIDLKKVIEDRFGVAYHERHVSTLLKRLGFSHVSARPRHPAQDAKIVEAFKKTFTAP
jgi:transposase